MIHFFYLLYKTLVTTFFRYGKPETCCGESFPDMKPKQKGKQCCAHVPWDPNTTDKQCCPSGKLKQTCGPTNNYGN